MKDINIILGSRIRARRDALKLSRERLAEQIDVSPRFLADVEGGRVGVSIETLKQLSQALDVSSDYLLGISAKQNGTSDYLAQKLSSLDSKYYLPVLSLIQELEKLD